MRRSYKVPSIRLYDLRIEGQEWRRGMQMHNVYHAIEFAFKQKNDSEADMLFVIEINDVENFEEKFCMCYTMWEALCETPEVMGMYLRICGFP